MNSLRIGPYRCIPPLDSKYLASKNINENEKPNSSEKIKSKVLLSRLRSSIKREFHLACKFVATPSSA
jgi:hypothetical protein